MSTQLQAQGQAPLRVVMDDNTPPYVFRDERGALRGILIDRWQLWQEETGHPVQIVGTDWDDALGRMRGGEFDVLETVSYTEQRAAWLDFSNPYARLDMAIFFDREIAGIVDLDSVRGFPVAAKSANAALDLLRAHGVQTVVAYDSYESIVIGARDHEVHVFVADLLPGMYHLNKLGIRDRFRITEPVTSTELHWAVQRGDRATFELVSNGFSAIDPAALTSIDDKWYGRSLAPADWRWAKYAALGAAAIIIVLGAWVGALRRAVRRRADALRRSESRLRAVLHTEPECVQVVGADGRITEINPAGLRLIEAETLEEAGTRPLVELVLPEYREAYLELFRDVLAGENRTLEFELEGLQGARHWIVLHASALRGEDEGTTSMLAVMQNVTERKKAELLTSSQLRVLEMITAGAPLNMTLEVLLHAVEAQSPDMLSSILLVDQEGRLRHCAAPSLPREFIDAIDGTLGGEGVGSCGTAVHRKAAVFVADIEHDPLWTDFRELALRYGLRACWSTPIFGPNDEVLGTFAIYYRRAALPRNEHLRVIHAASHSATVCLNRHYTEEALKESEQRFRQVVENMDEVYWMTDVNKTRVLYVSPMYEKIWGRPRASLRTSPADWENAVHPDDRERVRAALSKQPLGTYKEEYRIVRADGSIRWIRESAFPIRDVSGRVYRLAGVSADITERRELEEQMRQAQKMDAIGALAAGIAHDFNNVLSVINGNTELALQELGERHPVSASLQEIYKGGQRARHLVQQILAFTRVQRPDRQVTQLGPVIEETLDFLRSTLPASVELSVEVMPDLPNASINPNQVEQILLNVVTNGWHALQGRRGQVRVSLRGVTLNEDEARRLHPGLAAAQYCVVSVTDTGCGMNDVTLQRAFEPFFTTRPKGQGTGLGLAVVRNIMESHHGAVTIRSAVGAGTTVELYFPATAEEPLPASRTTLTRPPASGEGQRVLYIDDEESLVLLMKRAFERMGYQVVGFEDPHRALEAFARDPAHVDIVVTDYNMPRMSGLELAGRLLALRPDLPVLLTSGYVDDALLQQAERAGIRRVIYKPGTMQEFCDVVQRALEETPA